MLLEELKDHILKEVLEKLNHLEEEVERLKEIVAKMEPDV